MTTPGVSSLPPPRRGLAVLLPDHHRRLHQCCCELMATAFADDSRALVERWSALEAELLDHMAAEEEVILPAYATHAPSEACAILGDHARIRELVQRIGIAVELHHTGVVQLGQLVDALEAHGMQEDAGMYPWAERHLPMGAQQLVVSRIERWFA